MILHVALGDEGDIATTSFPRVIVEVAPGASATIIEHHVAQGERTPLVNSHTHLALGRGARVELRFPPGAAGAQRMEPAMAAAE